VFYGLEHQESIIFPVLFLVTKLGGACCYNLSYACLSKLFDVRRATRVLGVANFFARLVSSMAPLVSKLAQPTPMLLFCSSMIISGIISSFFKELPKVVLD
jgi:drug/metabolite transporter (DMT)-like permease